LKHKSRTNVYPQDLQQLKTHGCVCGKSFSHRQSLFIHKKKCKEIIEVKQDSPAITTEVVMQLIKQNQQLQNLLIDQNNKMYELAKEEEFYKQEYCGCIYSLRDTNNWRKQNDRQEIIIGEEFYTISHFK
jgi:predicted adenine nucleotide alpha hydrolase (AANH) superfamily ATPase